MPDREDSDPAGDDLLLHTLRAVAAAITGSDPYMAGHATRVTEYCERLADALGLPARDRLLLSIAAAFHDIGTLFTPAYVLQKPSVLAENEMEEVRIHPVKGAAVFAGYPELGATEEAILHHHERFDGSGYPDGLAGESIPLFSRIILVAETFEAMTHNRPYRDEAIRRLTESAGTQLDPALVTAFVAIVGNGAAGWASPT